MRKAFVVLEGVDGSGKTSLARYVADAIGALGCRVVIEREPTEGEIGALARRSLSVIPTVQPETMALLFAADRVEHCRRIERMFTSGVDLVLCHRYSFSSFAYQHVPETWNHMINLHARKPDLAFLVDVEIDAAVERSRLRNLSEAPPDPDVGELRRVAQCYTVMVNRGMLKRVDGNRPFIEVANDITAQVTYYMNAGG